MNYIPDLNRFQLATPPLWWLLELGLFDDQLVVLPSRQEPVFRLARRSKRAPYLLKDGSISHPKLAQGKPAPDTIMCAAYRLVPVTTLLPWGVWTRLTFTELATRDIWRAGGPGKAADMLDARDVARRKAADQDNMTELDARIGDAWTALQYRSGCRFSMADVRRPDVGELHIHDRRRVSPAFRLVPPSRASS